MEAPHAEGTIQPSEIFSLMEAGDRADPRLTLENRAQAIAWALETFREVPRDKEAVSGLMRQAMSAAASTFQRVSTDAVLATLVRLGEKETNNTAAFLHDAWLRDEALRRWVETLPSRSGFHADSYWHIRAYVLARATSGRGEIHASHMAAAALAPEPVGDPVLREDLRNAGVNVDELCGRLFVFFDSTAPDIDEPDTWRMIFNLHDFLGAAPAPVPLELVAGIRTDAVDGADQPDHLGIEADVNALASIVAARSVEPPLAIGLFGDWGAGKSFFMAKMEKRLEALCAREPATDKHGRPYHFRNIVQIRFNAWHYADGNLWASLMTRIFDGLSSYGVEQGQEDVQGMLREQLHTAEMVLGDAQGQLAAAETRRQQAEIHTRDVKRRQREVEQKVVRQVGQTTLQAVTEEITRRIGARWPGLTPAEILKLHTQLKATGGRARELWKWLYGKSWWHRVKVLALVIAVPAFLVMALEFIPSLRFLDSARLERVITTGAGLLLTVIGWVGTQLPRLNGALDVLSQAREKIEKVDAEVTAAGEKSLTALVTEEELWRGKALEAGNEVERIKKEIKKARPAQRLTDFLQERSQSADYRRHLGLVSLIRNDLSILSDLLRRARDSQEAGEDTEMPAIDRIVLYIDDLDRCPEDRVVQVLEAVHLLLAFPVFVVVVGVDSRWLLHALRKRYRAFSASGAATPEAYLEKIFQIPFTLRRMSKDGFGRFMDFLLPASAAQPPASEEEEGLDAPLGAPPPDQPPPPVPAQAPPATQELVAQRQKQAAAPASPKAPPPAPEPRPELLQLTKDEVELIKRVWPLIPTPRAANRLANSYRLIRVRIAEDRKAAFLGQHGPAEYPLVILLLAALIGFPSEFSELLKLAADRSLAATTWALFRQTLSAHPALSPLFRALERLKVPETDPVPIASVHYWLAVVCRFSFHLRDEALGSEQRQG